MSGRRGFSWSYNIPELQTIRQNDAQENPPMYPSQNRRAWGTCLGPSHPWSPREQAMASPRRTAEDTLKTPNRNTVRTSLFCGNEHVISPEPPGAVSINVKTDNKACYDENSTLEWSLEESEHSDNIDDDDEYICGENVFSDDDEEEVKSDDSDTESDISDYQAGDKCRPSHKVNVTARDFKTRVKELKKSILDKLNAKLALHYGDGEAAFGKSKNIVEGIRINVKEKKQDHEMSADPEGENNESGWMLCNL